MTAPHYGKRAAGALTAASPGDTIFFNFASYNDSGDSEALTGFAVTDIEVFKNGLAATRATDSGYSLISDTGQIGDRVGLYRFRIQLFNTADDTGHYEVGAWYQVAVDSVTIDGKTVRLWVGSFEIGEPRANVVQIDGDTGFADRLGKLASILSGSGQIDTGTIAGGFIPANVRQINSDTGFAVQIGKFGSVLSSAGQIDTGTGAADTGLLNQAVWQANAARGITASSDTGINQRFAQIQSDVDTGLRTHVNDLDTGLHDTLADYDTGLRGILITTGVNLGRIRGDTGGADRFYRYTQKLDTGGDATVSASVDTGQVNNAVWNGARSAHTTAGSFGQYVHGNLVAVLTDTGAAHLDAGRLGVSAAATVDTGQVNQAVWQANAQRKLTVDTGIADQVWMQLKASYTTDTGTFGEHLGGALGGGSASVDTGQINQAVWQANAARSITASSDTGINGRLATIQAQTDKLTFDTGANELHADIRKVNNVQVQGAGDTGAANTWRPV